MSAKLKFAFFGTPQFAVPALDALYQFCGEHNHSLALVVTQPDRPKGRGQKIIFSPVKERAQELGLLCRQPEILKKGSIIGDEFYEYFKAQNLDIAIVVAYGKIITKRFLGALNHEFINIHASLLPKFRGAAPIQEAIKTGEKHTGVCLMNMIYELDAGDVYAQISTPIIASDSGFTLSRRLSNLGAFLLKRDLGSIISKKINVQKQNNLHVTYAQKIEKEDGRIDLGLSGDILCRQVRAFDPWPGVFGFIKKKRVRFFDSFFIADLASKLETNWGRIFCAGEFLGVWVKNGRLYFRTAQIEGHKKETAKQVCQRMKIRSGDLILRQK